MSLLTLTYFVIAWCNKSSQSHLGRARRYPHVGEWTVPLCVIAVACTMHNEALWSITESLWGVAEHYGTLQSVVGRYRMLQKRCGSIMGCFGVLQNITSVVWCYRSCGTYPNLE